MKKIFVTGTPGWLGNRFTELVASKALDCQQEEYALRCLVLPGMDTSALSHPHVQFVEGNICDPESLKGKMEGCDYVVHMVGIIHPKKISDFDEINTKGTENILAEAIAAGVKRMVHISSNSPAGFNPKDKPFTEEDPPRPYMRYGQSKYKAELAIQAASKAGKIETVIIRPCWFYGPGQPARQTKFFNMIKKGNPIMFGSGENMRSVSYVDSVVSALILSIEKEGVNGELFWIADETPYSSNEIYETIAKILDVQNLKPRRIPGFSSWVFEQCDRVLQSVGLYQQEIHVAGEMARNIACRVDKAKDKLGYKPLVSLEEGMRRSLEWCRENGVDV